MFGRWLIRIPLLLLFILIGIPTLLTVYRFCRTPLYMYRSAQVRLEEFCPPRPLTGAADTILQTRIIPRSQYWRVALSMPPVPDAATQVFIQKLCYEPHHRIIISRSDGTTHQVEVCFECSKMRFDSGLVAGIPFVWEHTLRKLFILYGMPERSVEEYSALRHASAPNQSMKPTAPLRNKFSVFATTPFRVLYCSR